MVSVVSPCIFTFSRASLLLIVIFANGSKSCINELDCQLNGLCVDNECVCDVPWTGEDCAMLDVLPSPHHYSFHGETEASTSWGGSVLTVPTKMLDDTAPEGDVTYVMYVAEMVNECGLRDWTTNSAVAVATSKDPPGPYIRHGQIIAPWSHNPQAIQFPWTDEEGKDHHVFAVYTLGDGDGTPVHGPVKDCRNTTMVPKESLVHAASSRQLTDDPSEHWGNKTVYFTIHYSLDSPLGPFEPHTATMLDFPDVYDFPGNWNPAPVVLADGRVRMMVHTGVSVGKSGGIIVEAPTWKGPYQRMTPDVIECAQCEEDPFLWVDKRGNWHALFHKMFDPIDDTDYYLYDNYDGHPDHNGRVPSPGWAGGHAYSRDGLVWSNISRSYNTTTYFMDGTQVEMGRRERPKLIMDPHDGVTPTHLVNGVIEADHGTFTLVTPLRQSS